MIYTIPAREIKCDYRGFRLLTELHRDVSASGDREICLDFGSVRFVDGNMCAPLEGVLVRARRDRDLRIVNVCHDVVGPLCRNGFLTRYGYQPWSDRFQTAIPFRHFVDDEDDTEIVSYVADHLQESKGLPLMSKRLRKQFRTNVFEIFSNAMAHAESAHGIYSCGQVFPERNQLDFSVVDVGIGIRERIYRDRGVVFTAEEAIEWAVQPGTTTRSGTVPGGLGLALLHEFIIKNEGRLHLVSDGGFLEISKDGEVFGGFPIPFPGTVVNLEFNTADEKSYLLKSEVGESDVF